MHTRPMIIIGVVSCTLAMLVYLFVFADAPIAELQQQNAPAAQ